MVRKELDSAANENELRASRGFRRKADELNNPAATMKSEQVVVADEDTCSLHYLFCIIAWYISFSMYGSSMNATVCRLFTDIGTKRLAAWLFQAHR